MTEACLVEWYSCEHQPCGAACRCIVIGYSCLVLYYCSSPSPQIFSSPLTVSLKNFGELIGGCLLSPSCPPSTHRLSYLPSRTIRTEILLLSSHHPMHLCSPREAVVFTVTAHDWGASSCWPLCCPQRLVLSCQAVRTQPRPLPHGSGFLQGPTGVNWVSACFSLLCFFLIFPTFCGFLAFAHKNWSLTDLELHFSAQIGFIIELFLAMLFEARHPSLVRASSPKRGVCAVRQGTELEGFGSHQTQLLGDWALNRTSYGLSHVHA